MAEGAQLNGTTVTFSAVSVGTIVGFSYVEEAARIPVGGVADDPGIYEVGIPEKTTTVRIKGGTSLSKGDEGALVVVLTGATITPAAGVTAHNDWGSMTNAVITRIRKSGSTDNATETEITFKPAPA
jgi:hypothetical protein